MVRITYRLHHSDHSRSNRRSPSKEQKQKAPLDFSKASAKAWSGTHAYYSPWYYLTSAHSALTKPAVGVFDLASNVSEGSLVHCLHSFVIADASVGIRNTTTVFDKPERDRVRPVSATRRHLFTIGSDCTRSVLAKTRSSRWCVGGTYIITLVWTLKTRRS